MLDGVLCDENTAMLIETRFQLAKQADDCFLLVGERQQETAAEPRIGTQLSFRGRDMELASLDVSHRHPLKVRKQVSSAGDCTTRESANHDSSGSL